MAESKKQVVFLLVVELGLLFTTSFEADRFDHPFVDSPGQGSHQCPPHWPRHEASCESSETPLSVDLEDGPCDTEAGAELEPGFDDIRGLSDQARQEARHQPAAEVDGGAGLGPGDLSATS